MGLDKEIEEKLMNLKPKNTLMFIEEAEEKVEEDDEPAAKNEESSKNQDIGDKDETAKFIGS